MGPSPAGGIIQARLDPGWSRVEQEDTKVLTVAAPPTLAEELTAAFRTSGAIQTPQETSGPEAAGTSEAASSASVPAESADKGVTPPAPSSGLDWSFVPETVRSQFTPLGADAHAFVRDGVLRRERFTQLTQDHAEEVREFNEERKAFRGDARLGRMLHGDNDAYSALQRYLEARAAGKSKPPEDEDEDLDLGDPDKVKAWKRRVREEASKDAREAAQRVLHERLDAPQEQVAQDARLLEDELVGRRGMPREAAKPIAERFYVYAVKNGLNLTPENVSGLIEPFVASVNKPESVAPVAAATNGSVSGPRKVSPSHGSGGIAPLPAPAFEREGRPPSGRDEFHTSVLHGASRAFGKEITHADLDELLFNSWGKAQG